MSEAEIERRLESYVKSVERVLRELKLSTLPKSVSREEVESLLQHTARYLEDSKYYWGRGDRETALSSICYCEGLLDALRLLGLVEFSW